MRKIKNVSEMNDNAMGGHNSDELLKKYVTNIAGYEKKLADIRGQMKEELNSAKQDGFLKMAIKKAVKNLRMTDEQRQAHDEVESETLRITELCSELPLFKAAA